MRTSRIIFISLLGLAITSLVLRMMVIKIKPGQSGVLNAEWTVGLVKEDFGPGYHWDIGPFHTWTVFDTTVQTLHMVRSSQQGQGDVYGALVVKSKEGADVKLDVTLKYKIAPKMTWIVFEANGPGDAYKNRVYNFARDVMRIALGGLSLEAFYKASDRKQVSDKMENLLKERLAEKNVELVSILIRDLEFEEQFQRVIKDKTLASQRIDLNIALERAAAATGLTDKIEAETQANVTVINEEKEKTIAEMRAENDKKVKAIIADYEREVVETKSDADLYAAQQEAKGIEVLKKAEADGQTLRRSALATPGGEVLVALELVRNLKLGTMTVSTQQVNLVNVEDLIKKFGVER